MPATRRVSNDTVWWLISKDHAKTVKGAPLRPFDEIGVQWNVKGHGDTMFIDQGQDRLELSQGQVYDLIDALNQAMGKMPPTIRNVPI